MRWFSIGLNILLFKTVWFSGAIFANQGLWVAIPASFTMFYFSNNKSLDIQLACRIVLLALLSDGILFQLDIISAPQSVHFILPLWLWCIWLAFSLTLLNALSFAFKNIYLACLLGAIFGPLSYWSGSQLGAINFAYSTHTVIAIYALLWSAIMAFLTVEIKRLKNNQLKRKPA
ncbi:DUF2878 domain-containing protein [Catenovulum sediminis]|uniref:DUF2878 domain-containing protein n=1 Tax=Catenovulum sediminis TaxID=1740262 RepID=A0ABV1RGL6_9ALTE